jgi:hypothetical protein
MEVVYYYTEKEIAKLKVRENKFFVGLQLISNQIDVLSSAIPMVSLSLSQTGRRKLQNLLFV